MIWGFPPGRLFKAGRLLISDYFPPGMLIKGRTLIDFWKMLIEDRTAIRETRVHINVSLVS